MWYKLATGLKKPKDHWGFINEACWTWLPHIQLSVCYYHLGDHEEAYLHNEKARKYNPNDEKVLYNKRFFEDLLKNHQLSMPYPRLTGFCLLVKKSVLDEIGLFDERFGLGNFEDDDLCLRARMKGQYSLAKSPSSLTS